MIKIFVIKLPKNNIIGILKNLPLQKKNIDYIQ